MVPRKFTNHCIGRTFTIEHNGAVYCDGLDIGTVEFRDGVWYHDKNGSHADLVLCVEDLYVKTFAARIKEAGDALR